MKRACLLTAACLALWQTLAFAQVVFVPEEGGVPFGGLFDSGQFFVAIISGVLLALAFQMLLTHFSLAAGLSALGVPGTHGEETSRIEPASMSAESATEKVHKTIRGIGAGFGIWSIITAGISLFAASWLAVRLSGTATVMGGAILGLVIWGFFYVMVTTLEATAAASAVGALANMVKRGFQGATQAAGSLFTKSDRAKTADQAEAITAAVRDELLGSSELRDRLGSFFDRLTREFGPERHRRELTKLLDDVEIKSFMQGGGLNEEDGRMIMQLSAGGGIDADRARSAASKLKDAIQRAKAESSGGKNQADKVIDAAVRASGFSGEESESLRRRMETFLRQTGRRELDPEGIKQDLMNFLKDPKSGIAAVRNRASAMGRETATAVLTQQQAIPKEQAEMIVERVVGAIRGFADSARDRTNATVHQAGGLQDRALNKVEAFLASIDRPALDPASVRHELEMLFHDPKHGAGALYERAKSLSRDDVKALLANYSAIAPEHAERWVDQVMAARDKAVQTADNVKREAQRRMELAKEELARQAEEVRRTAATAAWWMFAGALASGVLAALGGWLAARPAV